MINFFATVFLKNNGTNKFTVKYLQDYTLSDSQYIQVFHLSVIYKVVLVIAM